MKAFFTQLFLKFLNAISGLSWATLYRLSDVFRFLIFDIGQYRKEIILANLKNSFPTYDTAKISTIARQYYRNFTDIIFETLKLKTISERELRERFEVDRSSLDHYCQRNKTIIVVAGHIGNWEMLNLAGSALLPYHMVVVYHELANDVFGEWVHKVRTRFGTEMVPMKDAIAKAVEPRDKPTIFILINDQSPVPAKAYWTRFLHQDTGVFRGVEAVAKRLNAPVLYMSIQRRARGFYKASFKKITDEPKQEPTNLILQRQVEFLEADIIAQPDNWLWSHRRWKHRRPEHLLPSLTKQEIKSEQAG